jgi:MFS family permease
MQRYRIDVSQAADMSSMIYVGIAIGAPFIGWLSDRIQTYRPLMIVGTLVTLLLSIFIIYVSFVSIGWMFVLLLLLGAFSGVYVLPFAIIRTITPVHMRGTAMGYTNMMCILIGAPLLQPLIGWLLHLHARTSLHAYHEALLVIPVSLVIALGLAVWVREEKLLAVFS